jgi:hypothetical protein
MWQPVRQSIWQQKWQPSLQLRWQAQSQLQSRETRTGGQAMNARTDGWELWTDVAGRRHWRWPATDRQPEAATQRSDAWPRRQIGVPQRWQPALKAPLPPGGK